MQLPHVFIAFFMCDQAFPHVFIAVWHPLGFLLGTHWDLLGLLLDMLEGLWSFLGILWGQNVARNIKMRVSKSILAQVEVARGSQRVSMGRFWEDVHHLLCAIWYCGMFFCKKGFVHHGCSVALQLLFSKCWTWSRQRRRRGRRPHDVHVRCLDVHGTIHMIVAKSAAWSYLKRAWGNDQKFKRASRSLAKTVLLQGFKVMKNRGVF